MSMLCPYGVSLVCSKRYAGNLGKYWGWGELYVVIKLMQRYC